MIETHPLLLGKFPEYITLIFLLGFVTDNTTYGISYKESWFILAHDSDSLLSSPSSNDIITTRILR